MPTSTASSPTPRAFLLARLFGYFVFFVAFFLPACRQAGPDAGAAPDTYKGYFCAWITIINTLNGEMWKSKAALAILSGWINPLMLLYVASLFSRKLKAFRRIVAVLILLFIVCTWIYFYLAPMMPLIGHALWVAGILLILAGELVFARRSETASAGSASGD
jgi:hypothetical protein